MARSRTTCCSPKASKVRPIPLISSVTPGEDHGRRNSKPSSEPRPFSNHALTNSFWRSRATPATYSAVLPPTTGVRPDATREWTDLTNKPGWNRRPF